MSSDMKTLNLKGSAEIVTEFFYFAINSILYQRGVYPPASFEQVKKYGLTMLVTADPKLKDYLKVILKQLRAFLLCRNVDRLAMEIVNRETKEAAERWDFHIHVERAAAAEELEANVDLKLMQERIRAVIRQITASISFLPLLDGKFCFDLLLYTDKDTALPSARWADQKPNNIANEEKVQLKGFQTGIQQVVTTVAYKGNPNC